MGEFWATIKKKLVNLCSYITVEPVLLCYVVPSIIGNLAVQNLNLEKACRVNLHFDSAICDRIASTNASALLEEVSKVHKLVSNMNSWKAILQSFIPACLILSLGSFSDRTGRRKPFMLLPIFGELITNIGLILCTYYEDWPMEVGGVIQGLFPAITGSWVTVSMAVYSYLGDLTSVKSRTIRIGVVNMVLSMGSPIGNSLSGILYQQLGFYGVFSIVSICHMIGLLYGYFLLKEVSEPRPVKNCCESFFSPKEVMDTFKGAFESGDKHLRHRVILLMFLSVSLFGPVAGEITVGYLFSRIQFNWDEVDYSIFSTYVMVVNLIGTSLALAFLTHVTRLDDSLLGAVACTSKIIASGVYSVTKRATTFYLAVLIEIFGGTSIIAMRSIASKLVPSKNLAKLYSLFGVCEAIVPMVFQPIYSSLYGETVGRFNGAFFVLSTVLSMPGLVIFIALYFLRPKGQEDVELSNSTNQTSGDVRRPEETMDVTSSTRL